MPPEAVEHHFIVGELLVGSVDQSELTSAARVHGKKRILTTSAPTLPGLFDEEFGVCFFCLIDLTSGFCT